MAAFLLSIVAYILTYARLKREHWIALREPKFVHPRYPAAGEKLRSA